MRRLEHLASVEGMEVRVVIAHASGGLFEHRRHSSGIFGEGATFKTRDGKVGKFRFESAQCLAQEIYRRVGRYVGAHEANRIHGCER